MSAATSKIPRAMLPLSFAAAVIMVGIASTTNVKSLLEFGSRLYGSGLSWTLPSATIGYELFASIVYFLTPAALTGIKRSTAMGALGGFAATSVLAIVETVLEGGPDMWLRIIVKPLPSLIAAGSIHVLVSVWHAKDAAAATTQATPLTSTDVNRRQQTAARPPAAKPVPKLVPKPAAAAPLPLTPPASDASPARPRPAVKRDAATAAKPTAEPAAIPEKTAAELKEDEELAALEAELAALEDTPAAAEILNGIKPPTTRVGEAHIAKARQLRAKMRAAGGDPDHKETGLKSGELLHEFGLADRTVRAVLEWARYREILESVAAA